MWLLEILKASDEYELIYKYWCKMALILYIFMWIAFKECVTFIIDWNRQTTDKRGIVKELMVSAAAAGFTGQGL